MILIRFLVNNLANVDREVFVAIIIAIIIASSILVKLHKIVYEKSQEINASKFIECVLDDEVEKKGKKIDKIFAYVLGAPTNIITIITGIRMFFRYKKIFLLINIFYVSDSLKKEYIGKLVELMELQIGEYYILCIILWVMCLHFRGGITLSLNEDDFLYSAFKVQFYLLAIIPFSFILAFIFVKI